MRLEFKRTNKIKSSCIICKEEYTSYKNDFLRCYDCNEKESKKMLGYINRPKIPQINSTKHLTIEQKKEISAFIIETHGILYENYKDAPPFIFEKLGYTIDPIGIRSIVNSSYFKEMAFKDCD